MAFTHELEHEDVQGHLEKGEGASDPPTLRTAVPTWNPGEAIPLGRDRTLRVIETRPGAEPDGDPVLVAESA